MSERNNQLSIEIDKMKQGNFAEYQSFYNLSSGYIYRMIWNLAGNEAVAAQILPGVYDSIYKRINELSNNTYFYQWAGLIATDMTMNYMRSQGQAINVSNMPNSNMPIANQTEFSYEDITEDKEPIFSEQTLQNFELQKQLMDRVDSFPLEHKIILQYYYYEGLSVSEIAGKLGCNPQSIKGALGYIRNQLKDVVGAMNGAANDGSKLYSFSEIPLFWVAFQNVLNVAAGLGMIGDTNPLVSSRTLGLVTAGNIAANAMGANVAGQGMAGANGMAGMNGMAAGQNGAMVGANGMAAGQNGAMAGANGMVAGAASNAGTMAGANGMAAGTAGAGVAGAGAATSAGASAAATVGFFGTLGGKIAIAVLATVAVAGGGVAIYNIAKPDKDKDKDKTTEQSVDSEDITTSFETEEITEEVTEEVTEETTEEVPEVFSDIYTIRFETSYTSDVNYYGDLTVAIVEGAGFEALSENVASYVSELSTEHYDSEQYIMEDAKNVDDMGTGCVEDSLTTQRADLNVLSFSHSSYQYAFGAHGYGYTDGASFDVKTGNKLAIADLGDVKEDMKTYIVAELEKEDGSEYFWDGWRDTIASDIDNETLAWYLDGTGVVTMFNAYEIASYADGPKSVTIPYEALPGFKTEYLIPEGAIRVQNLNEYLDYEMDLNGDGTMDTFSVLTRSVEEYAYEGVLTLNGVETVVKDYMFYANWFLVTTEDNAKLLVCVPSVENDYRSTVIYDITEGTAEFIGEQYMGVDSFIGNYAYCSKKIDILGSYSGTKRYKVTRYGFVEDEDVSYFNDNRIGSGYERGPVANIDLDVCFEENGFFVDGVVPAGTTIYPYSTDEVSFVDFYLEDGTFGRINIERDADDWYNVKVQNGIDQHDAFSDIPFAG